MVDLSNIHLSTEDKAFICLKRIHRLEKDISVANAKKGEVAQRIQLNDLLRYSQEEWNGYIEDVRTQAQERFDEWLKEQ